MKQFAVGCACCSFLPPRRVDREKSLSVVDMWVPAGFQFCACVAAAALLGRKGRGCARALQSPARGKVSMASGIGKQVGFSVAFPFDAPSGVFTMHVCPGGLRRLDRGRNPEVERGRSYGRWSNSRHQCDVQSCPDGAWGSCAVGYSRRAAWQAGSCRTCPTPKTT